MTTKRAQMELLKRVANPFAEMPQLAAAYSEAVCAFEREVLINESWEKFEPELNKMLQNRRREH